MNTERKWMLAVAVAVLLTAAASQAEPVVGPNVPMSSGEWISPHASHNLIDLQVNSSPSGPVEIELIVDGEAAYESLSVEDPDRFVLDLQGVVSRLESYSVDVGHAGVSGVRAAQHDLEPAPVTRVVFDLDHPQLPVIERRGSTLVVVFDGAPGDATTQLEPPAEIAEPTAVASLVHEMEARHPETEGAEQEVASRSVEPDLIEQLLGTPAYDAPEDPYAQRGSPALPASFETRTITGGGIKYSGKAISLNLVDADLKQVFRLFHEISGLNFVLDPSVAGRVTIVLDQVPWDQALDIILKNNGLDKVLENNVIRVATTQKLAQEAAGRKHLKEAEELEVEPITITRTLSYAKARDVERVVRESGVLSPRGRAIVDERTNTLIISDIPKKVDPVDALVSVLDAETPQVMIEARIVETSRDWVQDLGIVWGAQAIADASRGTSTGLQGLHNASVRYGLNLPGRGQASTLAFKFGNVIDSFTLDLALHTLETEGYGRVISSPKIATQNNERAEIEQGTRIPITNTTATEINVEFVSASLKLMVTPQITAEGTIILEVIVENNSADFVNTSGGVPSIRTQRAQTKVMISDGGTTVIGGIFTVTEGKSEIGVPWFRKIPVFGWLFKAQNITKQNRELLIFITPKIMRTA